MFHGLVDASFDAVIISHRNKIIDFNAKALELFAYDETELKGLDVFALVADERNELVSAQIEQESHDP